MNIKKILKNNFWFYFFVLLSVSLRVILFIKIGGMALGSDVSRFSIVSHVYFLKQDITSDLRPYDMSNGYFYFPGFLLFPTLMELLGIDPITGITLMSFVLDFFTSIAVYLFAKELLGNKKALAVFFFYSFVFNFTLPHIFYTTTSFGLAFLPLFLLFLQFNRFMNGKKFELFLLVFVFLGFLTIQFFVLYIFLIFLLAVYSHRFINKQKLSVKNLFLNLTIAILLSIILLSPFYLKFIKYANLPYRIDNYVSLMRNSFRTEKMSFTNRIIYTFFYPSFIGDSFITGLIGLLFFIVSIKKLMKTFFIYLFIYSSFLVYLSVPSENLMRNNSLFPLIYSFTTAISLSNPILNVCILPFIAISHYHFIDFYSPISFYKMNYYLPTLLIPEQTYHAFKFIKDNTSENSTFLIDGGGDESVGASTSYGERIFSLTSRKIFYFTNYRWADYDKEDYRKRIDLYRRISINPDDSEALNILKKDYGITHVFVGHNALGLNATLFKNSKNYELMFNEKNVYIFKIL